MLLGAFASLIGAGTDDDSSLGASPARQFRQAAAPAASAGPKTRATAEAAAAKSAPCR
jgi:hypothetical protein